MYKYTRQDAADVIWVSTRSIDRYVKSGKIRSEKDGKIVYLHTDDVHNIAGISDKKQEIIVDNIDKIRENSTYVTVEEIKQPIVKESVESKEVSYIEAGSQSQALRSFLDGIYSEMKEEMKEKDEKIQELSLALWKAEEITKNSVNLVEYKKSQFLLEESRNHLNNQISDLKDEKERLEGRLSYEKKSSLILLIIVIVLLVVAATVWFMSI